MSYIVEYTTLSGKRIPIPHKIFENAESAEAYGSQGVEEGNYKTYTVVKTKINEGYKILPPMDKEKYQARSGLEGPFSTLSGKVVYYDPKAGKYYDPDTDMYMSYDEFKALDEGVCESVEALKQIVADKSAAKVHGVMVDMFTASAIMQVYDAVSDKNKASIEQMLNSKAGLMKMADFAMKQINEWGGDDQYEASERAIENALSIFDDMLDKGEDELRARAEAHDYLKGELGDLGVTHGDLESKKYHGELEQEIIQIMNRRDKGMREDEVKERKLSKSEKAEREKNVKGLKKHKGDFEKRYGKDAESVMYAVATKRAKKVGEGIEDIDKVFNNIMKQDPGDEGIGYLFDKVTSNMSDEDADELAKKLAEFYPEWYEQHYQGEGNAFAHAVRKAKMDGKKKGESIEEGVADEAAHMERDHEVQMARSDLYKIANYAVKLHKMLKNVSEEQGIQGWMQAKITKAADYMSSVAHTLEYDMMEKHQSEPMAEGLDASKYHCKDCGCQMHNCKPDCNCEHDSHDETGSWWVDANGNGVADAFESIEEGKTASQHRLQMVNKIKKSGAVKSGSMSKDDKKVYNETTTAGAVASVPMPMGKMIKRKKK